MSHINIFQFSESPIRKEDYISDTDLYDSYGSVDPLLASPPWSQITLPVTFPKRFISEQSSM